MNLNQRMQNCVNEAFLGEELPKNYESLRDLACNIYGNVGVPPVVLDKELLAKELADIAMVNIKAERNAKVSLFGRIVNVLWYVLEDRETRAVLLRIFKILVGV